VQGGFVENAFSKIDASNQEEWALVKLRLYMTLSEWEQYKVKMITNLPKDLKAEKHVEHRLKKSQLIQNAEQKYENYLMEMNQEMHKMVSEKLSDLSDGKESGIDKLNKKAESLAEKKATSEQSKQTTEAQAEQLKIGGSNRIYERKLKGIAELRQEIQEMISNFADYKEQVEKRGPSGYDIINGAIEMKLKKLRQLVSEAALYSNEAYITDAAVYHAVVGLQGGVQIEQSKAELMNAVTENMADSLKEIARHGKTLGEAGYKSAKYYMRMADAAKNMGCGSVEGVQLLYDAGYEISVGFKKQADLSEDGKMQKSEEHLKSKGIASVEALKNKVIQVGTAVRESFDALTKEGQKDFGQKGAGKDQKNTN